MSFREQIKQGRETAGLSQEELAEKIGVSRQAVSKWELGLSEPRGANRNALCELLSIEIENEEKSGNNLKHNLVIPVIAFILASVIIAFVLSFTGGKAVKPEILSVDFYSSDAAKVEHEALWYDTAKISCILLQWRGASPESVKMFFTPSGTETLDQTELLSTTVVYDGLQAALISAEPLHRRSLMGHLHFELSFADQIVVSDEYNVIYEP